MMLAIVDRYRLLFFYWTEKLKICWIWHIN